MYEKKERQWEIDYEAQTMKQIKIAVDAATAATQKRRMKAKPEARIDSKKIIILDKGRRDGLMVQQIEENKR